ncbi:methionyl-tRNA formyltransferase [Bordetella bronchiseptica]|uniref:methionyl-tRNA formyltransferase n=1 Tax=Bordetella bronchiseptica TaxID=518 RepID=UPI00046159F8|nr:formyltransferase family protein [Bordetella bronchiseptica]KDD19074.1 formyl transferase, C-terminal domain protein [Bordetella bronchiseptica MBORD731]
MKFVAIGRHEILLRTIEMLLDAGHELAGVLTAAPAPEYRADVDDFRSLAARKGVPCHVSNRYGPEMVAALAGLGAEIAVSYNFPTVIGHAAIDSFPRGILNAHGGDLPRYRGNACQAWALIQGEPAIGLCVHYMVADELDSGDVIAKAMLDVDHHTTIGTVAQWMEQATPPLFVAALESLQHDPGYVLYRQCDDGRPALRCYPRQPSDGRIDWTKPAIDVVRHINASGHPYAGAFFYFESNAYRVDEAQWIDSGAYLAVPGQVAARNPDGSVDVACGGGGLCRLARIADAAGHWDQPVNHIKSMRARLA